ncbi:MAG TPA: class I adenylate-forming enzyme family protein [Acidimicrobiales bacterium]|nr:class I adenylate-forming enzyme family protein [Acidimicrobiales bacterium]
MVEPAGAGSRRFSRSALSWEEDTLLPAEARVALTGPGAPFEMVDEPVLGARMRVFARRPANMRQVLEGAAGRFGERPFLVFPDRTFTYRSMPAAVSALAASLHDRFGVGPGSRVAIAAANCAGHALTAWAAVCLGAAAVELNGWWTGAEMLHGIGLTSPSVVLGDRKRLDRLPTGSLDVPAVCFEDDLGRLEAEGRGRPMPAAPIGEDDPLCILFTSGTTGRPKGAVLSHRAHVHMMMQAALQGQVSAMLEPSSRNPPAGGPAGEGLGPQGAGGTAGGTTRGSAGAAGAGVSIGVSPMFHISGFSVALIGGAMIGLTIAYPPPGRWDPEVHLAMTERLGATSWSLVPTQLWRLLEHPRFGEYDLSSLRRVGGGGSTFQPELWRRVREKLPHLERMGTGYGMTETCGAGTHQDGRAAEEHPEAVGAPVPGYSIAVAGPSGEPLDEGEVGELYLRGPCNFLGYWDDPAATSAALDGERWYRTGELGHLEGGLLYLDGRRADLIVRGGENVYPIEIENRLVEHPAVADAAVVGLPDRVLGEKVKAFVVLRPGESLAEGEMRHWVAERLAAFKVPAEMEVVPSLPRNAAGKVLKQQLREGSSGPAMVED